MTGHAYVRRVAPSPSDQFRESTDFLRWELAADQRITPPPTGRRRRWPKWLVLIGVAVPLAGWVFVENKSDAISSISSSVGPAIARAESLLSEAYRGLISSEETQAALPALRLLDTALLHSAMFIERPMREIAPSIVAGVEEPEPNAKVDEASVPSSDGGQTANNGAVQTPAPLPPLPPLTDPLQKKAEAVGLHPELSRALLQSLSAVDFRNAAAAIKKAVAETPEGGALIWPEKAAKGDARFRVHFVPGNSPACRRYVVGVAKSGWTTTALPMERCGAKPKLAHSQPTGKADHSRSSHAR